MYTKGLYCLCIFIKDDLKVCVGALGVTNFISGKYIYVGSALNGLEARIKRHIETNNRNNSTLHWHIDYLLKESDAVIKDIYILETIEKQECMLANNISLSGNSAIFSIFSQFSNTISKSFVQET